MVQNTDHSVSFCQSPAQCQLAAHGELKELTHFRSEISEPAPCSRVHGVQGGIRVLSEGPRTQRGLTGVVTRTETWKAGRVRPAEEGR